MTQYTVYCFDLAILFPNGGCTASVNQILVSKFGDNNSVAMKLPRQTGG